MTGEAWRRLLLAVSGVACATCGRVGEWRDAGVEARVGMKKRGLVTDRSVVQQCRCGAVRAFEPPRPGDEG